MWVCTNARGKIFLDARDDLSYASAPGVFEFAGLVFTRPSAFNPWNCIGRVGLPQVKRQMRPTGYKYLFANAST